MSSLGESGAGDDCSAVRPPNPGPWPPWQRVRHHRGHNILSGVYPVYIHVSGVYPLYIHVSGVYPSPWHRRSTGNGCRWDVQKAQRCKPIAARSYLLAAIRLCLKSNTAWRALTLHGGVSADRKQSASADFGSATRFVPAKSRGRTALTIPLGCQSPLSLPLIPVSSSPCAIALWVSFPPQIALRGSVKEKERLCGFTFLFVFYISLFLWLHLFYMICEYLLFCCLFFFSSRKKAHSVRWLDFF